MSIITKNIDQAIAALQAGEVVAIPTETVYGLAGNAENERAVRKIFALKNRPLSHPLISHVGKNWDLSPWVEYVPDYAKILMERFWPGPLTLVFQAKNSKIPALVRGGQDSIAMRCPAHPVAQTLLAALNFPLAAPSANPFGKISPTTSEHVQKSFACAPLLILEGGRCDVGIESSIVAATHPDQYAILRHGAISEAEIQGLLSNYTQTKAENLRAPGKMASHYQPEKPLYCFEKRADLLEFCKKNPGCFALFMESDSAFSLPENQALSYQLPNTPEALAFELYYQLRRIDESEAQCIAIELPPATSAWEAIRERLFKAAFKF